MITNKIFLIGAPRTGKSTIGKKLANKLHLEFYDTFEIIARQAGVDITWIWEKEGEEGLCKREEKIITELAHKDNIVVATSAASVLQNNNCQVFSTHGTVLYLALPLEEEVERLAQEYQAFSAQELPGKEALARAQERLALYEVLADLKVEIATKNIVELLQDIVTLLKKQYHVADLG